MFGKYIFIILGSFGIASMSFAQVVDIGQNDDITKESITSSIEEVSTSKTVENAKDGGGVFSFMKFNFWNSSKEKAKEEGVLEGAVATLAQEAEAGNVESQLTLAFVYLYGNENVLPDYEQALKYYQMAADLNDKVAINNLGSLYYSGIGTKRDVKKAAELFDKAVSLGNSEAGLNLAFIYLSGMGLPKDYNKAIEYFQKSAEAGNSTAKFMYGYALYRGFVVEKDLSKAFVNIKDAADAKYDDAQYILARMYLYGEGVTKNYNNTVRYYTFSGEQGNTQAMKELADILETGKIYPKNLAKAHVLYNIASVRGDKEASEKRDFVEAKLKIEEILPAQNSAEAFAAKPSEITNYINDTFGYGIRKYIDDALIVKK